ncbi:MAG: 23S rRNA (pseudouridine(1915)-N(3))-methyltransferase RlmH [bacterium]
MAEIRVIWVGKTRNDYAKDGVAFYQKRLKPYFPLKCLTIKGAAHSGRSAEAAVRAESDAILKALGPERAVVLLDEGGREFSSLEFGEMLRRTFDERSATLCFVLGGAYGVDARVRRRADETLSLSRLTFPHQLARVILLEQLYRAASLRAGHPYHHE